MRAIHTPSGLARGAARGPGAHARPRAEGARLARGPSTSNALGGARESGWGADAMGSGSRSRALVAARIASDQVGAASEEAIDPNAPVLNIEEVLGEQNSLRVVNEPVWKMQRDMLVEIRRLRAEIEGQPPPVVLGSNVAVAEAPTVEQSPAPVFGAPPAFEVPPPPVAEVAPAAPAPPVPAAAPVVDPNLIRPARVADLGANLTGSGCGFKVWAPKAEEAWVVMYNEWGQPGEAVSMSRDGQAEGYWGVHIDGVRAGAKYHLRFSSGGNVVDRRDAYARQVGGAGEITCTVVDPAYAWAPFQAPAPEDMVMYELHVGSFTGLNDNAAVEGLVSTFKEAEKRIEHIRDLGFNVIQLMPTLQFSGLWGYNPTVLLAPHTPYGTPEDMRHFVDACHKEGIAVLFDAVLHHGSAKDNSLWDYDGWSGDEGSGGIYFEGSGDTPWGREFSFWKQEVVKMLEDSALIYLREYNADGIRFDSAHAMPKDTLKTITKAVRTEFPDTYLVAELTPEDPGLMREMGFSGMWMQSAYFQFMECLNGSSLGKGKEAMALMEGLVGSGEAVNYFMGSHDQAGCRKDGGHDPDIDGLHRHAVDYFGGRDNWHARARARLLYSVMAMSPGIPMIFMGSECYHDGWWHTDEKNRMNWSLSEDDQGLEMMELIADSNRLRRKNPALTGASLKFTQTDDINKVIVFRREMDGQRMYVVANLGEKQWDDKGYGIHVGTGGGSFKEVFNSQDAAYGGWVNSGNADGCGVVGEWLMINLPKLGVLVLEEE